MIKEGWHNVWVALGRDIDHNQYQGWCVSNIDQFGNDWIEHYMGIDQVARLVQFKHADDAILFKLTFADYVYDF